MAQKHFGCFPIPPFFCFGPEVRDGWQRFDQLQSPNFVPVALPKCFFRVPFPLGELVASQAHWGALWVMELQASRPRRGGYPLVILKRFGMENHRGFSHINILIIDFHGSCLPCEISLCNSRRV